MDPAERRARTLFQQIAIDGFVAHQGEALLPALALGGELLELILHDPQRFLQAAAGLEPARAMLGMEHEVADRSTRYEIERERDEKGSETTADDHAGRLALRGLCRVNDQGRETCTKPSELTWASRAIAIRAASTRRAIGSRK